MKNDNAYVRTSISLPPTVYRWLQGRAQKFGVKMSGYVLQLMIEDMKREEDGNDPAP